MTSQPQTRRARTKRASAVLNILVVVAVFFAASAFQTRNMLSTSGAQAPELEGPLLRGGRYALSATGARPVLVYFFAPWCTYCALSSDNLKRLRRFRADESLEILIVALDWKNPDEVRDYVERHDLDMPVVLGDRRVAGDWQVYAFPTYYVLDSQLRIHRRDLGYSTQLGLWWRTWFVD